MDIRLLKYYAAVARCGSISKAAEQLHITQPTLSRQLKELEDTLQVTLLNRERKQLTLTDEGVLFLQRAREIIALEERTLREVKEKRGQLTGTIGIGCVETNAALLLTELVEAFFRENPAVKFEFYNANSSDIKEKLDQGSLDLGILLEPVEGAKYDYLRLPCRETWGVIMPEAHPLAAKEALTTADIQGLPLCVPRRTIVIEEIAHWLGVPLESLNIVAAHNLLTNILLLVRHGFCCSIIAKGAYEIRPIDGLVFRPFTPLRTTGHLLIHGKNRILPRTVAGFLAFVQDYLAKEKPAIL